ncbi:MAG: hypothetical protein ACXAES_16355, partial [Promethearchaeota archaeon]
FEVDEYQIFYYPRGAEGEQARQLAFLSGELDIAADVPASPLDYDQVVASVNHEYIENGLHEGSQPGIWLNCVNESAYWTNPAILGIDIHPHPNITLTIEDRFGTPNGIPRAIRQALSYSYDYDTYINTEKGGRAVRSNLVGTNNEYYNPSIPLPDTDLAVARAKILAAYPTECSARGLDGGSNSSEWINIGENNPIWTGSFHYDDRFLETVGYMEDAAHQIGCDFDTIHHAAGIWPDVQSGALKILEASAFSIGIPTPEVNVLGYLMVYYKSADFYMLLQARTQNFPFLTNSTIDGYLFDIYLNNGTAKQDAYDVLAYEMQNIMCPMIFNIQPMVGIAHSKEWEVHASYWGAGAWITQTNWVWQYPSDVIPGYTIPILGAFSTLAMMGIIYVIIRKKKIK